MLIYTSKLRYFAGFFLVLSSLATFCDTLVGSLGARFDLEKFMFIESGVFMISRYN